MSLSSSLKAQSDSVCFTHEVAELIGEQLADFKELSKDHASLQESYHSLKVEHEILKMQQSGDKDKYKILTARLKTSATTRRSWRKLRKELIIEL